MTEKKIVYPKTIGACIDMLYKNRAERLALNTKIEELKKSEGSLEAHIINSFSKTDITGAKGKVATAGIKTTTTVDTEDWDTYLAYVVKNKAWDLLRKQPAVRAVQERWEQGQEIPGVKPFVKIGLSLTKV
jgi:hypothetical protein